MLGFILKKVPGFRSEREIQAINKILVDSGLKIVSISNIQEEHQKLLDRIKQLEEQQSNPKNVGTMTEAAEEIRQVLLRGQFKSNELVELLAFLSELLGRAISGNKTEDVLTIAKRSKEEGFINKGEHLIALSEDLRMLAEHYADDKAKTG